MKTLTIGFLILVIMSGQLNADNHSEVKNKIALSLDNTPEVLVKGFIAPLEASMLDFPFRKWDALVNLRVAEPEKRYPTSVFRAFLPDKAVSVGELWRIKEKDVLTLLQQLHPNPNLDMHINMGDSRGLWACLHAYNDQFANIAFRIHAEFKLEDGWFTPSQFAGTLTVDRIQRSVVFFEMSVPEGTLNFDANWKTQLAGRNSPATITATGFCSQMELRAGMPDVVKKIEYTEAITYEETKRVLMQRFYEWAKINWVPPDQALEMAQTQQKPIHVISIDGPLTDEAC